MANRTTKLELEQLLALRNKELETARMRISVLEGEVEMLRNRAASTSDWHRKVLPAKPVTPPSPMRLLMDQAKALAMQGKRARIVNGCLVAE